MPAISPSTFRSVPRGGEWFQYRLLGITKISRSRDNKSKELLRDDRPSHDPVLAIDAEVSASCTEHDDLFRWSDCRPYGEIFGPLLIPPMLGEAGPPSWYSQPMRSKWKAGREDEMIEIRYSERTH